MKIVSVKELCSAGLHVGRLWEAGSAETCFVPCSEGGVWVSKDVCMRAVSDRQCAPWELYKTELVL